MDYDTSETPPCPAVQISITDITLNLQFDRYNALVDTGASRTSMPETVAAKTPDANYFIDVISFGGRPPEPITYVRILIADVEFFDIHGTFLFGKTYIDLVLPIIPRGLVGRDILNYHQCGLDGPVFQYHMSP